MCSTATIARCSRWTAASASSPACASVACGWAMRRAASRRGAIRASRFAALRCAICERAFAQVWAAMGAPIPPGRAGAARRHRHCGRCVAARRSERAGHHRHLSPRSAHRRCGAPHALADGCVFRRRAAVRAGAARRRDGWRGRAPARAGRERHPGAAPALAGGLSPAARSRHPRVRVEGLDAAREDGGGGRSLGARGLQQSQHRELGRQLRARCGGGERRLRCADGAHVSR